MKGDKAWEFDFAGDIFSHFTNTDRKVLLTLHSWAERVQEIEPSKKKTKRWEIVQENAAIWIFEALVDNGYEIHVIQSEEIKQ